MEKATKRDIEHGREELAGIGTKLAEVGRQLNAAYRSFNVTADAELIDASIYEINALDAKYSWLLCTAKSKAEDLRMMEESRRKPRRMEERA